MRKKEKKQCLIIAEVAQAHDGSLNLAHAFIDAIAKTGVDAIKFQTHIASAESTKEENWRVKFSKQDKSRFDYWKRMEFSEAQWLGLKKHAIQKRLKFISSPFSVEAFELLKRVGVFAWKIASGEAGNKLMYERILQSRIPVLLSTGMSPLTEIDAFVKNAKKHKCDLTIMQCTSMYPTPAQKIGLNIIPFFRSRYHCKVGLSDHSGKIFPGIAAAFLGISALEIHVILDKDMAGPDACVSLIPDELKKLAEGVRFIESAVSSPVNKDTLAKEMSGLRKLFTKSIVARKGLIKGSILRSEDLAVKKPGTGIPAACLSEVLGKKLLRAKRADEIIKKTDLQ